MSVLLKSRLACLVLMGFVSCRKIPVATNLIDYSCLPVASAGTTKYLAGVQKDSFIIKVDFDVVINSMMGNFITKDNHLFFADKITVSILQYDTLGQFRKTMVHKGRGPGEITELQRVAVDEKGNVMIMDASWGFTVFQDNWTRQERVLLDFNESNRSVKDRIKHPNPNQLDMYEIAYDWENLKVFKECFALFPVTIEHPDYNGYQGANCKHFYKNSMTLGILNLSNSSVGKFCNYSPFYHTSKFPHFSGILFDTSGDTLFYSFPADSLLYMMDLTTRQVLCKFGTSGLEMNQNYDTYLNFEQAEKHWKEDMKNFGFYSDLNYENETGLLFRVYYQGDNRTNSHLQIYDGLSLIADIAIPKSLYYIGYINGFSYFTSSEPDTESEQFIIYKYKFILADK